MSLATVLYLQWFDFVTYISSVFMSRLPCHALPWSRLPCLTLSNSVSKVSKEGAKTIQHVPLV